MTEFPWVTVGVLVAILFWFLNLGLWVYLNICIFKKSQTKPKSCVIDFDDMETILKEGPANHYKGIECVGGWLYLTDKRLIFVAHNLNVQVHELNIPLNDIGCVDTKRYLRWLDTGLLVETSQSQDEEEFVVYEPQCWKDNILKKVG